MSERENRRKELDHLRGALKCNGYLEWILRDLKEENNSESEKEVETSGEAMETSVKERSNKIPVVIPYVKRFSEQMNVFGKYGIPTFFKPTTTEPRWFERGVKEAIYIRALNPSLNKDGGRYDLKPV